MQFACTYQDIFSIAGMLKKLIKFFATTEACNMLLEGAAVPKT